MSIFASLSTLAVRQLVEELAGDSAFEKGQVVRPALRPFRISDGYRKRICMKAIAENMLYADDI